VCACGCVCLCVLGDCVCEGAGGSTNLAGKAGIEGLEKAGQVCLCVLGDCVCEGGGGAPTSLVWLGMRAWRRQDRCVCVSVLLNGVLLLCVTKLCVCVRYKVIVCEKGRATTFTGTFVQTRTQIYKITHTLTHTHTH